MLSGTRVTLRVQTTMSPKAKSRQATSKESVKEQFSRWKTKAAMRSITSMKRRSQSSNPISLEEMHDPQSGLLDAARIADVLGLSLTSFAKAIGRPVATVHRYPASKDIQEPLKPIASVITILTTFLDKPEHVRMWINSPNPELGYQTAMSFITAGRAEKVRDLLSAALSGQIT